MKVLHLVDRWSQGGVPQVIKNICRQLKRHGHSYKIVTYRSSSQKSVDIGGEQTKLHALDGSIKTVFYTSLKLQKVFRQYQPDVIHDHYGGLWSGCYLFRKKWAKRAIYHLHNEFRVISESPDAKRTLRTHFFLNYLVPRYHKIIAISRHVSQTLMEDAAVAGHNIDIVHNSIDTSHFLKECSTEQNVTLDYDLSSYEMVIGTVGRFVYEKGFDTVVDILHHLRSEGVDAAALLVGSGDDAYEAEVKAQAKKLNISEHCRFTGYQVNTVDFMQAMDYFLFCSRQEPFGITLLEAMACKVPVVASRQKYGGGPDEILEHNNNALITGYEDSKALAREISALHTSPEREKKMIEHASECLKKFSHEKMYQLLEKIYDEIS